MKNDSVEVTERTSKDSNVKWKAPTALEISEKAAETARAGYEALVDIGKDVLSAANRRAIVLIRQYPVEAAAGSLAIGFLLGASIFRRKD
jgi:hypothetical protein